MCGRFALGIPRKMIRERFALEAVPEAPARYNIAPGQLVEAVVQTDLGRGMELLRWGLKPHWAKNAEAAASIAARTVNARTETAADKPAFRGALRYRRCLAPAQGFYEWTGAKGARQPWFISPKDGSLMALAAIWEHWSGPGGQEERTLSILTCEANAFMRGLHGRMPVLVNPADDARWLDPELTDPAELADILAPGPWPPMNAWMVGQEVNLPGREGPQLAEPLPRPA